MRKEKHILLLILKKKKKFIKHTNNIKINSNKKSWTGFNQDLEK